MEEDICYAYYQLRIIIQNIKFLTNNKNMTSYPIEKCTQSKPKYLTSNQKINPVSLEIKAMQIKIIGICPSTLLSLASGSINYYKHCETWQCPPKLKTLQLQDSVIPHIGINPREAQVCVHKQTGKGGSCTIACSRDNVTF